MISFSTLRFLFILCLTGLTSCNSSNPKKGFENNIHRIELCPKKIKMNYLYASEIVSDIEYIALETSEECLINGYPYVDISDNYIITSGDPHCLLFSRQGKFLRLIGSKGQGPEEHTGNIIMVTIDEKLGMIYIASLYELLAFRISGEFIIKLNLNDFNKLNKISTFRLKNITHWKDDLFCANIDLNTGKELYKFVVFSIDGNVVKLFPNYNKFEMEGGALIMNSINDFADIFFHNGQLKFREQASDTLFCLTDKLELVPDLIFDLCGRSIPTNMRGNKYFSNRNSYTCIYSLIEIGNHIFLSCNFGDKTPPGLSSFQELWYNKNSHKLTILKQDFLDQNLIKTPVVITPSGMFTFKNEVEQLNSFRQGFINDIDGGNDFFPTPSKLSCNKNNQQLVCHIYQPYNLLEKMTEEYFISKEIKNKEANRRLRNLLKNLNEEDNPVLMIATFK